MLPYLFFFMPLAWVAIHPPSVENSTLSGSCPMVKPCSASCSMMWRPTAPAWMQAMRLAGSIHTTRFMRPMSTETMVRRSSSGQRSAAVTLVPPP